MTGTAVVAVGIDFETSGDAADCACAIGLARVCNGRLDGTFYSLIRPPNPRIKYTEIHGLTWPVLKGAPSFAELWPGISAFLRGAQWLVAHNAPFDRRVLHGCCARAHVAVPPIPFACTLKGARAGLPALPSKALGSVCAHLGIPLNHHHAGSDAEAAALIFCKLQELGISAASMHSVPKAARTRPCP